VVVGQQVSLGADHEAGSGRGAATFGFGFAKGRERLRFLGRDLRFDEGDPVAVVLVDLVDDVAVAIAIRLVDHRRRQRSSNGGHRAAFGLDPAGRDRDPAEGGDDSASQEGSYERGAEDSPGLIHGNDDRRRR
jgi:hypothetical protein